jgi:simple sugar transport system ATP-binding protein
MGSEDKNRSQDSEGGGMNAVLNNTQSQVPEISGIHSRVPVISCRGLDKWYAGVHALKNVDLDIQQGEVIGLVGDNGAGKSTLINILSGAQQPDVGEIRVNGELVDIDSTRAAIDLGIETIYQHTAMVATLSIARNIFLGRELMSFKLGGFGWIDHKKMAREAARALALVGQEARSPNAIIGELSGGQRQGVAIARAMYFKSKVMILDEPTNHLAVKEINRVLEFVQQLKSQNVTVIFISHNIHHVYPICDRIVMMARGAKIADTPKDETSIDAIHKMLGA